MTRRRPFPGALAVVAALLAVCSACTRVDPEPPNVLLILVDTLRADRLGAFTLYNGAIRIPLIIVAPGMAAGNVVEQNVSLVDLAPTLLELAGAPPAASFEGRSLVPFLRGGFAPAALWARLTGRLAPLDVISEIERCMPG